MHYDGGQPVSKFDRLSSLTSRRSIRSRRDLWFFVARICGYVMLIAGFATAIQVWQTGNSALLTTSLAVALAAGLLATPIVCELGELYLDLWKSTQALRELASKDQQTRLLNNRSFVAAVEERLSAGRRVALLLGDLDRFKSINDRHGHLVGDEVIARVGETLRDIFDEIAVLGRMGGEEYAVMIECPFDDAELAHAHAGALAEEMRRRVAMLSIASPKGAFSPAISVGIAWARTHDDFSDLYARADKALYVAKAAGRDRVVGEHEIEIFDPERVLARRQDLYWRPASATRDEEGPAIAWA